MNFGKLSNAIHTAKATYQDHEFTIRFRGVSLKLQEELRQIGGIEDAHDVIKLPEYLKTFVVSLTSEEDTVTPTLEQWKEADITFQSAVFQAIQEALNPGKSTASLSSDTSSEAISEASTSQT